MPLTEEGLKFIEEYCRDGLKRRGHVELAKTIKVEPLRDFSAKISGGGESVEVNVEPDEAANFQRYPNASDAKPGIDSLCRWRGEQGAVAILHAVDKAKKLAEKAKQE